MGRERGQHSSMDVVKRPAKDGYHHTIMLKCQDCGEVLLIVGIEAFMGRTDQDIVNLEGIDNVETKGTNNTSSSTN
jgi:hypothetical protein